MPGLPHFNYYLNNTQSNMNSTYSYVEHFGNPPEDIFVMFYAPWCGHCKNAEPHFDSSMGKIAVDFDDYIAGNYKKHDGRVALVKVNGDKHPKLAQKMGVEGYPTFKYISGINDKENLQGANIVDYNDARNESAFTNFCKNNLGNGGSSGSNYETFEDYRLDYDYTQDSSLYQ